MKKKTGKFLYWTPRILSIIFIFFLALMSLDVFSSELNFWQIVGGLFMHNIPALVLLAVLIISWKYEIVGGIAFIMAGILYILLIVMDALKNQFEWYMVSWSIQIAGTAFLIGILFLMNWFKKKK
ncbi:MAG: hypothetical protein AABX28_01200 [Nanoarchaeota archaeon]